MCSSQLNGRSQPYKEHVPLLADKLQHCDPEVSLAVRLGGDQPYEREEEDGLDEFLLSHGFEYVDGDRAGRVPTQDGGSFSDEDSLGELRLPTSPTISSNAAPPPGIPGLPRVIDALSTIMWPSLVQSTATTTRKSRARELLDWARQEEAEDGLRALVSPAENPSDAAGDAADPKKSRMQREMDELERWLEADAGGAKMDDAEAWERRHDGDRPGEATTDGEAGWADVPTPVVRTPGAGEELGFEDDFAEFVGAPVDVAYEGDSVRSHHTGASYRSLASTAEHGDDDVFGEAGDPDLPSRDEVEETSKRIFGDSLGVPSASRGTRSPAKSRDGAPLSSASSPSVSATQEEEEDHDHSDIPYRPLDDDSFSVDHDTDEDDFELGAFDMSRVLGALQNMKEEISGMEDEEERRKAAARVALGLVYGLQKEDERAREGGQQS